MNSLRTIYAAAWRAARPILARNRRLGHGWDQRTLQTPLPRARVWIQAASGGEARLTGSICRALAEQGFAGNLLATTNTKQGLEVLQQEAATLAGSQLQSHLRYCPLDDPRRMTLALDQARPAVVGLLETELGPGLLHACQDANIPVLVLNARMRPKSLARYLMFQNSLPAPAEVWAVSQADQARYQALFGARGARVRAMPNIKFDLLNPAREVDTAPVADALPKGADLVVLGSMRKQEVLDAAAMAKGVLETWPLCVVGLFPRHMEHVQLFAHALQAQGVPHVLRSQVRDRAERGTVVIWDEFGQLGAAYHVARSAFVGGSLAPLGGQNVLEPLAAGVVPVCGPSLYNFAWATQGLPEAGLLTIVQDAAEAAQALTRRRPKSLGKPQMRKRALQMLSDQRGGSLLAAQRIAKHVGNDYNPGQP